MFCQFLSVQQNESAVHINVAVVQSLIHVQLFCNPMDCSLPVSSVHGMSQARILKLVAISISNTYTYNFFGFGFPSHLGYHRALSRVPCAIQQAFISYFKNSSMYMSTPISQFISPLPLPSIHTPFLYMESIKMVQMKLFTGQEFNFISNQVK